MSNTPKPSRPTYSVAQFARDAKQEPFPLEIDDETTILIEQPSTDDAFAAAEAMEKGDTKRAVALTCGEHGDAVLRAFGPAPVRAFEAFSERLAEHFNLGESNG